MQPVEIGAIGRLLRRDGELARTVVGHQVLTDPRRLRHSGFPVEQQRNGAERINLQIVRCENPRGKWQHLELVAEAEFLECPERTKGSRERAMIQGYHLGMFLPRGHFRLGDTARYAWPRRAGAARSLARHFHPASTR